MHFLIIAYTILSIVVLMAAWMALAAEDDLRRLAQQIHELRKQMHQNKPMPLLAPLGYIYHKINIMDQYLAIYKGYLIVQKDRTLYNICTFEEGAPPLGIAKFSLDACKEYIDQHPLNIRANHTEVIFNWTGEYFTTVFSVGDMDSPEKQIKCGLVATDIDTLVTKAAYFLGLLTTWPEETYATT